MNNLKSTFLILLLIIIFGLFLRTFGLEKSPPSLNWDEASIGYNAYSILKTGKDEYGASLPLFIRSFDDYKSAIPVYLSIPFIAIFGLNEVSVRAISILAGVVNIILVFFISSKLFGRSVGLLAATFMAISPFAVHFSRILFEANIALSFLLTGFLCFLFIEKSRMIFLSALLFVLALYTYHSYKALIPLLALLFIPYLKSKKTKRDLFSLVVFVIILLVPLGLETLSGNSLARFSTTSVFSLYPPPITSALTQTHQLNVISQFFLHNDYFYFLWELGGRYLAYFSPNNLFLAEAVEPNLRIPYLAVFYPFMFIFWLVGLIFVFKNFKNYRELVILILLSPIPAVLTWNWFHSVRVLPLFATYTILTGLGVKLAFDWLVKNSKIIKLSDIKKQFLLYAILIFWGIWSAFYLLDGLIVIIPSKYFGDWQPGFKESIPVIASLQDQYDQIIIESPQAQPYIFTLFYSAYSPDKYLKEINLEKISKKPRDFYDFGKFKFRKIYWPEDRSLKKTIFMGTQFSLPEKDIKNTPNAQIIKDVLDKDGNIAVRIVIIN